MADFPADFDLESPASKADGDSNNRAYIYRGFGKRLFDLAFVMMLSLVLMILCPILYIAIRLDGGPAFYGHRRIGRSGKAFTCWKFRTMVQDADQVLAEHLVLNSEAAVEWWTTYKLKHDPRITRVGKFLRRTSLDELPQIWNIICGEMSLVGPRPVIKEELAFYGDALSLYFSCRPGLTGLWQVSGRNNLSYDKRVLLDCLYATHVSLFLDLKILLKTIFVVLRRTGW